MHFVKWQACGNDFVFVNGFEEKLEEVTKHTEEICDRHFGIGADGIIFVLPSDKADLRMRIFNADGSEAEMCGNGIRAFAKWAHELGLVKEKRISVETGAGILYPELEEDGLVKVDMGKPHLDAKEIPTVGFSKSPVIDETLSNEKNGKSYQVTCVSMGNPHCVIFTDEDVDLLDLPRIGHRDKPALGVGPRHVQRHRRRAQLARLHTVGLAFHGLRKIDGDRAAVDGEIGGGLHDSGINHGFPVGGIVGRKDVVQIGQDVVGAGAGQRYRRRLSHH